MSREALLIPGLGLGRGPLLLWGESWNSGRSGLPSRRNADIWASWSFSFSEANMDGPAWWLMSPRLCRMAEDRCESPGSGVLTRTDRRRSRT